jgi:hypothetical protein
MEKLNNKAFYEMYLITCMKKAAQYLSTNPELIKEELRMKLIKGAIEHGEPVHDIEWMKNEVGYEYLDILGWGLLIMWNEKRIADTDTSKRA